MTDSDLRIELDSLTELIRPTILAAWNENGLNEVLLERLESGEMFPNTEDGMESYEEINEALIYHTISYMPGYGGENAALVNRLIIEATKTYGFKEIIEAIGRSTWLI